MSKRKIKPTHYYQNQKSKGLCVWCGAKVIGVKGSLCRTCREINIADKKRYKELVREYVRR